MIHDITSLQPIKILRETGASQASKGREVIASFQIYTFLDSDVSTLLENRNNFQFTQDSCAKLSGKLTCLKSREISIMVIPL
jgi:hypothetical protein